MWGNKKASTENGPRIDTAAPPSTFELYQKHTRRLQELESDNMRLWKSIHHVRNQLQMLLLATGHEFVTVPEVAAVPAIPAHTEIRKVKKS